MSKADPIPAVAFDKEDRRATKLYTIFRGSYICPVSRFIGRAVRDLPELDLTGEMPVDLLLNQAAHFSHGRHLFHEGRVGWTHGTCFRVMHLQWSGHGDVR